MENNLNPRNGNELNGPHDTREFVNVNSINLSEMLNDQPPSKKPVPMPANALSKNNDELNKPVNQETKGLDSLSKNNDEIDLFYQDNINKDWSIVDRLTNKSMYKHVQNIKKELFKTSAEYRLAFYKTMLDTRLEFLNEKCSAGVKMVKSHYRHQVSSFLMNKMEQLSFEVRDRQFSFLEMMKTKYAYSETLHGYPSMQQRYLNSIFEEEGKYLKFLDGLLDKFISIVDEELKKYNV